MSGQEAAPDAKVGLPVDWSFRHLIHTQPWTASTEAGARREPRVLYNWLVREQHRHVPPEAAGVPRTKFKSQVDWNFTLGAGKVAANMAPAKFTFSTSATPSCSSDYVVFGLDTAGSSSQPNLVRFNNLYTAAGGGGFCAGLNGPTVLSAYNVTTSGSGAILTSPALSLDGTQVAFIESVPGGGSIFHVLTFGTTGTNGCFFGQAGCSAGTNTYSAVLPGAGGGNNAVLTSLSYSTATTTYSSPWVDYHNNVVYFGDDNGKLYKTTCAFHCSTPPAIASGWSVTVAAAGVKLGPAVQDPISNKIFVGGSDGKLYLVDLSICPGSCTISSLTVGSTNPLGGIVDAPLVDTTFQTVFAFSGDNGAGAGVVVQTNTTFTLAGPPTVTMGSKAFYNLLSGAFDNAYFTNTAGSSTVAGNLYACGPTGGSGQAALYQIGFSIPSGTLSTANPPLMGSGAHQNVPGNPGVGCSPITEFLNGATDRVFFSQSSVPARKCVSSFNTIDGCMFMYTVTSSGPSVAPAATAVENNGTSGVIVDNASASAQASSIYFTNEGTSGCTIGAGTPAYCAIKLTQSALQ